MSTTKQTLFAPAGTELVLYRGHYAGGDGDHGSDISSWSVVATATNLRELMERDNRNPNDTSSYHTVGLRTIPGFASGKPPLTKSDVRAAYIRYRDLRKAAGRPVLHEGIPQELQ